MTAAEKNIVEAYVSMFENFNSNLKIEILKRLGKSPKAENKEKPRTKQNAEDKMSGLAKSFGAWESGLTPEEEVAQLRAARRHREKDISLD